MIFEIIVSLLLAVASIAVCCTTALAWLILKAVGELQYRINNPIKHVIAGIDHGKDQD